MQDFQQTPKGKLKVVVCYICGREFGVNSLNIHQKQCVVKFQDEQKKKPKDQRKQLPQNTGLEQIKDLEEFNARATQIYNSMSLEQCNLCGRTFEYDKFGKHQQMCTNDKPFKPVPGFAPQKIQQNKTTTLNAANNSAPILRPRTLVCHICGREYGTQSLAIHIPQCKVKFLNEEAKKPPNQRRPLPSTPKGLQGSQQYNLEEYNNNAMETYNNDALVRCQNCDRTFLPDSLIRHQKACTADKPFKRQVKDDQNDIECVNCGKKVKEDKLEKHLEKCQQKQEQKQEQQNEFKQLQIEKPRIKVEPPSVQSPTKLIESPIKKIKPSKMKCYKCLTEQVQENFAIHIRTCNANGQKPPIFDDLVQIKNPSNHIISIYHKELDSAQNQQKAKEKEQCPFCGKMLEGPEKNSHIEKCSTNLLNSQVSQNSLDQRPKSRF